MIESEIEINLREEKKMIECIVVGAGGFIGAVCRYLIGLIPVNENLAFPVKTFAINILGSFVIGLIAGLALKNNALNPRVVLFLKVGICGGFTTFSSRSSGSVWRPGSGALRASELSDECSRRNMVYSVPLDTDLMELSHYPSIEITREDLQ